MVPLRSAFDCREASRRALPSGCGKPRGFGSEKITKTRSGALDFRRHLLLAEREQTVVPVNVIPAVYAELVSLGDDPTKEIGKGSGDLGAREKRAVQHGANPVKTKRVAAQHLSCESLSGEQTAYRPSGVVRPHRNVNTRWDLPLAERIEQPRNSHPKPVVRVDVDLQRQPLHG